MVNTLKNMIAIGILAVILISCSDKDGNNQKSNIFDNGNSESFMTVSHSSNADTLFLSWELTNKSIQFDQFLVGTNKSDRTVKADNSATKCFITHVPYDQPVIVSIQLMKGSQAVKTYKTTPKIDGLDKVTSSVIIPDRGSVTAGDGMYSIALPDGRSIFLMGDSYTGPVTNNRRSTSDHMYRNTYILYDNGRVSAVCNTNGNNTSGAVPPGVTNEGKKWYWPGHGFVHGNKLYIFQTLMYQGGEGMWGFMYEKTHILEYDLPAVTLAKTSDTPFSGSTDIHYGMAALNDGDYIYIYAQVDVTNDANPIAEAMVARTTIDNLYSEWEYRTSSGWSTNPLEAVKMQGLASVPISSQFNVFKLRNKYVLLTQNKRFNSGEIYTFTSDTPYGPWTNKKLIFMTYEQKTQDLFTYNAMAHPQFEKDGMILISYNVNTGVFAQQFSDVSTYRPRFFWYEIDKIINQ